MEGTIRPVVTAFAEIFSNPSSKDCAHLFCWVTCEGQLKYLVWDSEVLASFCFSLWVSFNKPNLHQPFQSWKRSCIEIYCASWKDVLLGSKITYRSCRGPEFAFHTRSQHLTITGNSGSKWINLPSQEPVLTWIYHIHRQFKIIK